MRAILAAALILAATGAQAQGKLKLVPLTGNGQADFQAATGTAPEIGGVKLTGNLKKDAQALWDKIQAASLADLKFAAAMAKAANTNGSAIRLQCWNAIIAVNLQSNGLDASGNAILGTDGKPITKPDPHLFTDVETAVEVIDNLSPQGALFTSCAGAAQLAQANVTQFIAAAITGAAGLAKLTPIPGL
jgi:hypothetical protein